MNHYGPLTLSAFFLPFHAYALSRTFKEVSVVKDSWTKLAFD
ncbi:hypothetical protein PsAD46_02995 [Pseudovibrio sp. Ad46]|nr:hypothetical protein PsAD46_02995 [Pseudovibrio sp. Ad46]